VSDHSIEVLMSRIWRTVYYWLGLGGSIGHGVLVLCQSSFGSAAVIDMGVGPIPDDVGP